MKNKKKMSILFFTCTGFIRRTSRTDFVDPLARVLLQLVSDALLWHVAAIGVVELALVPVRALLLVGTGLGVGGVSVLRTSEEDVESRSVASERIIRRHKPGIQKYRHRFFKSRANPIQ